MPIKNYKYDSISYSKTLRKIGSGTSYLLLGALLIFPLLSQAGSSDNKIEQQLESHILLLVKQWQQSHGITQVKPKLTFRSSSKLHVLAGCKQPIRFSKKSDKVIGVQQWQVTCPDTNASSVIRSQLTLKALLPVAIDTLKRGHVITTADLVQQWVNVPRAQGRIITRQADLLGKRVKHKLRRSKPIQAKQLVANIWITAGEQVTIEANADGFSAHMKGEALQSGGEGQAIKVKNLSSGKVILAYPVAKGKVATRF